MLICSFSVVAATGKVSPEKEAITGLSLLQLQQMFLLSVCDADFQRRLHLGCVYLVKVTVLLG
jgi:hypothetical protein